MGAVKRESVDVFRVSFVELAKARRGDPVQVDPYLIARAIALVMRECTVRAAAGQPLLWNDYRMILARRDFDVVRSLQGPLERDLQAVLAEEARARTALLVGELRITVVFDEADELRPGQGAVRVAFVPTDRLAAPRDGDMTVRLDGWSVSGEIGGDTAFVHDSAGGAAAGSCVVRWAGGEVAVPVGATVVLGRAHAGAPAHFVALAGASPKVNKQHLWIAVGSSTVRIGRFAGANPVHVAGQAVAAGTDVEVGLPVEVSLSRGELALALRRS